MSEIRTSLLISGESLAYRSSIQISVVTLNSNLVDTKSSFRTNIDITSYVDNNITSSIRTYLELNNVSLSFYLVDMTKLNQSILYFSKFLNLNFEPEIMWDLLSEESNEQINITHLSEALSYYATKESVNNIGNTLNAHITNSNIHLSTQEKTFINNIMTNPPWIGGGSSPGGTITGVVTINDVQTIYGQKTFNAPIIAKGGINIGTSSIKIGDAILSWDSEKRALKIEGNSYFKDLVSFYGYADDSGDEPVAKSRLEDLLDVEINNLQSSQFLVYNYNTGKWENKTIDIGLNKKELENYLKDNKYATTSDITEALKSYTLLNSFNSFIDSLGSAAYEEAEYFVSNTIYEEQSNEIKERLSKLESLWKLDEETNIIRTEFGVIVDKTISFGGADDSEEEPTTLMFLKDLLDVEIDSPENGQSLVYENDKWVNKIIEVPTLEWDNIKHKPTKLSDFNNDLGFITSVSWTDVKGKPTKVSEFTNDKNYITDTQASSTYATITALERVNTSINTLRTEFDALNTLLNGNVGGVIDTWNEVVAFLDGYSQSDDLATILSGMNAAIGTNSNNISAVSTRIQKFEDIIDIDDNGDVYIKGMRNFYTEGGTISMFGLGEGDSGEVASVSIKFEGSDDVYSAVGGIITLPAYPSGGGGVADSVAWSNVTNKPTTLAGYGITDALSVSGGIVGDLVINATSDAFLQILLNGVSKALVGWQSNHGVRLYNYASASYLSITDDGTPIYNGYTLYHTGNFNPANYLPLSGGIISTTNSYYPIRIKCPASFGQTGIRLEVDDTNMGALVSTVGDTYIYNFANSIGIGIYNGVAKFGDNTLLHSGNYSDYAVKYIGGASVDSARHSIGYDNESQGSVLPNGSGGGFISADQGAYGFQIIGNAYTGQLYRRGIYNNELKEWKAILDADNYSSYALPLSGGTIEGNFGALKVKINNQYGTGITFINTEKTLGTIGFEGNGNPTWWNGTGTSAYTLIHSGNIGSQSVNYASSAGNAAKVVGSDINADINYGNRDNTLRLFAMEGGGSNAVTTWGGGLSAISDYCGFQLYVHNSLSDIYARVTNEYGFSGWNKLAYITDNVASATKLQTGRYLWGNYFNGEQNISSALFLNSGGDGIYVDYNGINYHNSNNGWIATNINFQSNGGLWLSPYGGNVLIGTTIDNGTKLQVEGGIRTTRPIFSYMYGYNSNAAAFIFDKPGSNYTGIGSDGTTDTIHFGACDGDGNWIDYSQNWKFYGNIIATGTIVFGSDIRYKDVIENTTIELETIANAPLFNYKWNDRNDEKIHLGTSAQYWYKTAFKNAVVPTTDEKLWTMGYSEIAMGNTIVIARELLSVKREISKMEKLEHRVAKLEKILVEHNINFN